MSQTQFITPDHQLVDTFNGYEVINNRGLAYGDGFFSTMGVYQANILWQDYHVKRLKTHAAALQLTLDVDKVMQQLQKSAEQLGEGILKIVVTRKSQKVTGYGFINGYADVYIKPMPRQMPSYHALLNLDSIVTQQPIAVICLAAKIACVPPMLAGLKTLNRLDNVLAAGELQQLNIAQQTANATTFGEGLVQDINGDWIEGTMSNVFYQLNSDELNKDETKAGTWYTPPVDKSGVNGVMRQVLMDTIDKVSERCLQDSDLSKISALFFTNAVRGVIPVTSFVLPNQNQRTLNLNAVSALF